METKSKPTTATKCFNLNTKSNNLLVKLFVAMLCYLNSGIANAQYPISEAEIEANISYMAGETMKSNFWLDPTNDGAIGVVCYAFGSYYTGTNTTTADSWILQLNNDAVADAYDWDKIYFQMPLLLRLLLDPRFSLKMSTSARNHLLGLFYDHLNTYNYGNTDTWDIVESENHNAVKRSVDYLGALALSQSSIYKDSVFSDNTTTAQRITAGETYWKSYFLGRAQKGLELEIHSPTYTKYTLQCYYNIFDLSDNQDLRKITNLYMHLYWADIAQHFIADNDVVAGAMSRVYKKYIYKEFYQYPRHVTAQFGWTDENVSQHPGDFVSLVTQYRVPEIISEIATEQRPANFLLSNKSWGMLNNEYRDSHNANHNIMDPGVIGAAGGTLRQSYVTNEYVMGTTLYDIQEDFAQLVDQNRVMGVYFANNNDRILINGYSEIKASGERKGYRELSGVTGENCMVAWRPSKYNANNAIGTQIFVNDSLYNNGVTMSNWWFCEVGDAYVAMRTANQGWTWADETGSGATGGYFRLDDADSPIVIECAKASEYASFTAFQNDIIDNAFSFSNNTFTYTSSAGETFTTYRNNATAYPKINGTTVSFNPEYTYSSKHLRGISTENPYLITVSNDDKALELDFSNLTATKAESPSGQKQVLKEWNFTNNSLTSEDGTTDFELPAATAANNVDETGGSKDNSYTINGANGEGDILFPMHQNTGKFTYSMTLNSWSLASGPGAFWELSLVDENNDMISFLRLISQAKTGYDATSLYTWFKNPINGTATDNNDITLKTGKLGNGPTDSTAITSPVTINLTIDLDAQTYVVWVGDTKPADDNGTAWGRYGTDDYTGSIGFDRTIKGLKWEWSANKNGNTGDFIEIDRVVFYTGEPSTTAQVKEEQDLISTQKQILKQWEFTNNSLLSNDSITNFGLASSTMADNADETGGAKDNTYTINGSDGEGEILFPMHQRIGTFTYSMTLNSWSLASGPGAYWEMSLVDENDAMISFLRLISQAKTGYDATSLYTWFKNPITGTPTDNNDITLKAGKLGNGPTNSTAITSPVTINLTIDLDAQTYVVWVGDTKPSDDDGTGWGRYGTDDYSGSIGFDRTIKGVKWEWSANKNGNSGDFIEIDKVVFYTGVPASSTPAAKENIEKETLTQFIENKNDFRIYPNPSSGVFTVQLPNTNKAFVEIIKPTGDVIYAKQFQGNRFAVEVEHLKKGMYFLKITQEGQQPIIQNILIN